jgi:hypothetical protein
MQITLKTTGIEKVQKELASLTGPQARDAYARAINDTAYQVRRAMQAEFRTVFDRPTNYIIGSVRVKQATPDNLSATIEPTYYGGKGVDPQKILAAQGDGGTRRDKRSESALRRAGILPNGYQTAIPDRPYPGSDDGRGNLKGSFLVQLLSYFQAFGEQGYRANATDRRKANIHKGTAKTAGRRYFVAYGRLRGDEKSGHLAPGIWAASGTHSVDVRPVLMFTKAGTYRPRINTERIAKQANATEYLARRMRYRIRLAAGV